jgi:hypothetical protein
LHHSGICRAVDILIGYADRKVVGKHADGLTKMITGLSAARHTGGCLRPTERLIKPRNAVRVGQQRD